MTDMTPITVETAETMVLTYRVRLQPTEQHRRALESILEQQRQIYNAALEERIACYQKTGRTITDIDQSKSLTVIRADDQTFAMVQRRIQRATLIRLQRAFQAFFKRAKAGAGASSGFPTFRAKVKTVGHLQLVNFGFEGFGFDAPQQIRFDGKRLHFAGMCGGLRVSKFDMRRVPTLTKETWKGVHFKRTRTGWQATFQVVTPIAPRIGCGKGEVGVDWGTSVLAALSNGHIEPNTRPRETMAKELLRHERAVARSQKGSKRRLKDRWKKQGVEARIYNKRRDRFDKLSKRLVTENTLIAIEDIKVKDMMSAERPGETLPEFVKRRRNREALDAAPYKLRQMLEYKGRMKGARVIAVDPKDTTHECVWCGGKHYKELTDAVHVCTRPGPFFGRSEPRKVHAAKVILKRALSEIAKGSDDTAGRGRAGGGKPPNGGNGRRRPRNTSAGSNAGADGSRSG